MALEGDCVCVVDVCVCVGRGGVVLYLEVWMGGFS